MSTLKSDSYNYDFLALGEALIDFISDEVVDSLAEANNFQYFLGGQVTNLTMNMASLGKRVALAACVGDDGFGQFIREKLRQRNVDTTHLQTAPKYATSLAIVARQTKTPDFIIHRGADAKLKKTKALKNAAANARIIHTSAFALSRDTTRSTVFQVLEIAQKKGTLISLDPNYHPNIWPDTDHFLEILRRAYQFVEITKPSLDDCERIFGADMPAQEYLERFLAWGAKTVVLTMGAEGTLLGLGDGKTYHLQPSPTPVVDVTGAGDAFWSGLLFETLAGASPLESARFGQALAEIKIGTIGPLKEMPSHEQIYLRSQKITYTE